MEQENRFVGDTNTKQAITSSPSFPEIATEKTQRKASSQQDSEKRRTKRKEETNIVPFYKLFSFADPIDYFLMFAGTIAAVGSGICQPLRAIFLGSIINSFGQNMNNKDMVHDVSKVSLQFVYMGLGGGVASFLQVTCWMVTGERQAARIRGLYLQTILRQEISFFDKDINTGEVVGRMSGDTVLIQDAMGEKVGQFTQLVATFISGFAIAFVKGWLLTIVLLSSILPLAVSGAFMTIFMGKMASRGQTAYSLAAIVVEQTVGSIRTVASFTGEKQAMAKYNKLLIKAYKSGVHEALFSGLGFGALMFITFSSFALAFWYGAKMIVHNGYTGGDVLNVILAVLMGSVSLGQASTCLSAFAAGQAAAFKILETIKRKPEIDAYDSKGRKLDDICGEIELSDVYFSYPARPNDQILHGFSLSIPGGTIAALVGQSGSGKSTVISLIDRFYDPQAGKVLIDGINLKEYQLKWIREKIGLVSQEPVLFTSSIKDNIAYGSAGATDEEIRAAAELANAAKFIDNLPQGLDTMVGEHGTQLSGGQKQRVAIARAILKDPRILLLDEATSALDAESERIVQEALDRVMRNRTTVMVAHCLSTVRNADVIAVIHKGKIVEKGSHSELLKDPDGAYCHLIRLQEISKESEQYALTEQERPELSLDSGRHSSQPMSLLGSISPGSSRIDRSSRHPFSVSCGVHKGIGVLDTEPAEYDMPVSAPSQPPPEVPFCRLAYLNMPEIPVLLLGTIGSIANGVMLPIFAIMLSSAIKVFYMPKDDLLKHSRFWALMLINLGVASLVVVPWRSYFFAVAGCKLIKRVRSMCFAKVVQMEISWFDEAEHSSGAIGARLSADAASLRCLVGDTLAFLVQNTATAVSGLVIAFDANWQLALIMLGLLPLRALSGYLQLKFMKGFSADAKKMYEEASQVANDAVSSIRTVASFCAEEKVMQLYKKKCEGPMRTGMMQGLISGVGFGLSFFLVYSAYAISFYAGARLIEDGKTTFSEVFRVYFALTMTGIGLSQTSFAPDASKAKSAAASIFQILDRNSKIDPGESSGTTLESVKGEIEFRHVSFKYPSRPDIQIFQDLCLTINSGKTVALVGESGSGKSTVISLLQRFYDPDSGHVTLDGIEVQKLQLKWFRQQMGLVSQEPVLFHDTIRANIAYGKEGDATEAEIVAAAELANAHKFISALQQGYDTTVGERGVQLSGGQKQRVAIARAIMKTPKILLLDEATSALDAESERVVQNALDRVMMERTTVVVAHRLSTIMGADLIAVVKNGMIAEKGNHESLIKMKDGIYASLVALHSSSASSQ